MGKKFRTRVQGESLQRKIDADYEQYFCIWGFFLAFFVLTVYIWLFYFGVWNITLGLAITFSVFTFGVLVYGIRKSLKLIRHMRNCYKGMEGERLVGEMLNKLSCDSIRVFHDVCGDCFNVDHLIISTRGIFTIETKHYDRKKGYKFLYQDGKLLFNGRVCKTLLNQMDGEANFISEKLESLCGRNYPVQKVAIIVGAYIENPARDFSRYWILNESGFPKFFSNAKESLSIDEVRSIANQVTEWLKVSVD
ncbi:nuclease-related domain-containing protein [Fibrobacter sp.]|uniref:nuclease-related domain-containing protein n=1 Tax=Fibrobacter sp. TaxID=35828 RepID=UPI0025C14A3D|nr:nuclease-related domain-containing protein [Fibrobacter sp.]MBR3070388.1 NERD domain-containing protein [Fibrobacter sp.]